jgi:DNA-binding protein, YbaB/EbfC family
MKDVMGMMKQVQAMQAKMQDLQAELERTEVEGVAGGGLVKVRLTAKGEMKGVWVDDSLLKPEEKEILEDLLLAAHNDARGKGERLMQDKMGAITAGLPIPPGMKLPF